MTQNATDIHIYKVNLIYTKRSDLYHIYHVLNRERIALPI